ncbi:hypothetical protein Dimus_006086 [Dionaea muscipula]
MILATILKISGNNGICEYIKEVWEESTYYKPLEITRKFANDDLIANARRVKSSEMKPFQRLLHFIVMKNIVPRFGKRDTTSFMDLTYMDHLLTRGKVFEAFNVPLDDKEGVDPVNTDLFGETFLNMCQLKRENGMWWLGTDANRRRDDMEEVEHEELNEGENEQNKEADFVWEQVEEVVPESVNDEPEAQVQGGLKEKEAEIEESGSGEKFYDVVDGAMIDQVMRMLRLRRFNGYSSNKCTAKGEDKDHRSRPLG